MKRILLSLGLLTGFAGSAQAQSPCGLTLTKSGTGLTRTYTLTSTASGPLTYNISYYGNNTSGSNTNNSNSLTVNHNGGGIYYVNAYAYNASCIDSVIITDTVLGNIYCNNLGYDLQAYQTNYTTSTEQYYFQVSNSTITAPGYSQSTVFDYGDGTTGTSNVHSYAFPAANVKVKATTTYTHPVYTTCVLIDSAYLTVPTCSGTSNNISYSVYGNRYYFANNTLGTPGSSYSGKTRWYLYSAITGLYEQVGSGSWLSNYSFAANGNYIILATTSWRAGGSNSLCVTTDTVHVTVSNAGNYLNMTVRLDSPFVQPTYTPQVKTWLIKKDNVLGTLTAIDSVITTMSSACSCITNAIFHGFPAGTYRTKSHIINQPVGTAAGYLPTYSFQQSYWSNADTFAFLNNNNINSVTKLLTGTPPTSGTGFIGGLISQGANKGTAVGDPVAGIDVFLRDATGKIVKMATTDAAGKYIFFGMNYGTYSVYPEELNYSTTPSDPIVISATQNPLNISYSFKRNPTAKEYVPGIVVAGVGTIGKLEFSVAPNPATDKLQITLGTAAGKVTATLSNITGQVVMQEAFTGTSTELNVSQLPAGSYILQLQSGTEVHTEKVQIQH